MKVFFPGGLEVAAKAGGFLIRTDQPVAQGGGGAAPSPFDLFLASLATCAGLYALKFCRQRHLDAAGLELTLDAERDETGKRVSRIRIEISLPPGFPEKYRDAILRAADQCKVKRHIIEPPEFEVTTKRPGETPAPAPAAAGVPAFC